MQLLSKEEVKKESVVTQEHKNREVQALAYEINAYTKKLNLARDEYDKEMKKMQEGMDAMLKRYDEKLAAIQQQILEKKKDLVRPLN